MDNTKLLLLIVSVLSAQIISWYQSNSLLLWDWLKDNYLVSVVLLSPIVGFLYVYANKIGYEILGSLWAIRLSIFSVGYLVFTVLAWVHFEESPFTIKNVITSLLCFTILGIQIFWKN